MQLKVEKKNTLADISDLSNPNVDFSTNISSANDFLNLVFSFFKIKTSWFGAPISQKDSCFFSFLKTCSSGAHLRQPEKGNFKWPTCHK